MGRQDACPGVGVLRGLQSFPGLRVQEEHSCRQVGQQQGCLLINEKRCLPALPLCGFPEAREGRLLGIPALLSPSPRPQEGLLRQGEALPSLQQAQEP